MPIPKIVARIPSNMFAPATNAYKLNVNHIIMKLKIKTKILFSTFSATYTSVKLSDYLRGVPRNCYFLTIKIAYNLSSLLYHWVKIIVISLRSLRSLIIPMADSKSRFFYRTDFNGIFKMRLRFIHFCGVFLYFTFLPFVKTPH